MVPSHHLSFNHFNPNLFNPNPFNPNLFNPNLRPPSKPPNNLLTSFFKVSPEKFHDLRYNVAKLLREMDRMEKRLDQGLHKKLKK